MVSNIVVNFGEDFGESHDTGGVNCIYSFYRTLSACIKTLKNNCLLWKDTSLEAVDKKARMVVDGDELN